MRKFTIIALLILAIAPITFAAGLVPCGGEGEDACELCHFFVMAENIIDTVLIDIIPPIAILFVIIGGAYFILGSGYDPSLISKAKAMFWSVTIGLLIIYGSWLLINLFFATIGLSSTGSGDSLRDWWSINCP